MECANEVSHLHRFEELAVGVIHDDTILLAVADPDIAICRVNGEPMSRVEFSLSDTVSIPLTDESAGLVQVDYARNAQGVGGIVGVCVIGTFIGVPLAD